MVEKGHKGKRWKEECLLQRMKGWFRMHHSANIEKRLQTEQLRRLYFTDGSWFKCNNGISSGEKRKPVGLQVSLLGFLTFFLRFWTLCFLICCFQDILLPAHQKQDGCVRVCVCMCVHVRVWNLACAHCKAIPPYPNHTGRETELPWQHAVQVAARW